MPLVDEVVAKVVAGQDDPDLKWLDGRRRVRVLVARIVPGEGVHKQTLAGGVTEPPPAFRERMAAAGWRVVTGTAAHTFERRDADPPSPAAS